jgi:hypothetical protein
VPDLPKKMLWPEKLFSFLPIDKKKLGQQMLARFLLLFLIWLIGLVSYSFHGLQTTFLSNQYIYQNLLGTSFLILFGSWWVQKSLDEIVPKSRQMLNLNEAQFLKLSEKITRYSFSIIPSILITLVFFLFSDSFLGQLQNLATGWHQSYIIWDFFVGGFTSFLVGTAYWMFASIWLTIFLISRQPLNIELSSTTHLKFRNLTVLALVFSIFYFIAISLNLFTSPLSIALLFSPLTLYYAIGIIGILLPFYNIHLTLLKLKKQHLIKIEEELESLSQQMDTLVEGQISEKSRDQIIAMIARLSSLQIKERRIKTAYEWPINVGFLSKIAGLVLLPILGRLFIEIFIRYF